MGWVGLAAATPGVAAVYAARPTQLDYSHGEQQGELAVAFVNRDFFRALGVPLLGPGFSHADDRARPTQRECVLALRLAERLGSPDRLIGESLYVGGAECRIVAVVANGFTGLRPPRQEQLWLGWPARLGLIVPAVAPDDYLEREIRPYLVGLRLAPEAQLGTVRAQLLERLREADGQRPAVELVEGEGLEPTLRRNALRQISLLWVACLDFIAIGGVFTLALAVWQAESRAPDFALRAALGARRRRLFGECAASVLRIALAAAAVGIPAAWLAYALLLQLPVFDAIRYLLPSAPGPRGFGFALICLTLMAMLSVAAALRGVVHATGERADSLRRRLNRRSRGIMERLTMGAIVVVATFSSCLAIAVWREQDLLASSALGYSNDAPWLFSRRRPESMTDAMRFRAPDAPIDALQRALEAEFGEGRVALASSMPFRAGRATQQVLPWDAPDSAPPGHVDVNQIDDNFLRLLGIDYIEGGGFTSKRSDEVMLSRAAAQRLLGSPPWAGRVLRFAGTPEPIVSRVVGVVEDVRYAGLGRDPAAIVYRPMTSLTQAVTVAIDAPDAGRQIARVEGILHAHGLRAPLQPVHMLAELAYADGASDRVRGRVIYLSSGLSVALATVGLASMLSALLLGRLPEFAVRLAVGATTVNLMGMLSRQIAVTAVTGALVGTLAFLATRGLFLDERGGLAAFSHFDAVFCSAAVLTCCVMAALPVWRRLVRLKPAQLLTSE